MGIESATFDLKFRASHRADVRGALIQLGGVPQPSDAGLFEEFVVRDPSTVLEVALSMAQERTAAFAAVRMSFCNGVGSEEKLLKLLRNICEAMGDGYLKDNQSKEVFSVASVDWKRLLDGVREKRDTFELRYGRIEGPMTSQEFWRQRNARELIEPERSQPLNPTKVDSRSEQKPK